MNITSEELLKEARALEPQLQQWRRTIHRHPEVGFDLPHTKELVKKALTEMGYEPKDCGKAGIIALAGGKKPGKTILLRADMDALPIHEDSGDSCGNLVTVHLTVVIPAPQRQLPHLRRLHLNVIGVSLFVLCINIKTDTLRMKIRFHAHLGSHDDNFLNLDTEDSL